MIDGLTLGAYAIAPQREPLAGAREDEWYALLAQIDGASGLEVPFRGALHPEGTERFAELLPDGWHLIVSFLPTAVAAMRTRPTYGLASDDEEGRRAAVSDVASAFTEIRRLSALSGARTRAVHLHSAPRRSDGWATSATSLQSSLREIAAWDWGTTRLVVEHCDAAVAGQPAEKGFLTLSEEITSVLAARAETATGIEQSINWGRSAIEGRSSDTPVGQLEAVRSAGTLGGVFFSGASAIGGPLGGAWKDVHNPVSTSDTSSLLTPDRIARAIATIGGDARRLTFLGAKVQDPADTDDLDRRLDPLRATAAAVRDAFDGVLGTQLAGS